MTLIAPGEQIVMHPWTAALVTHNTHTDLPALHERALAMRWRRFGQRRGSYEDLLDIPRHPAALHRYDDIVDVAGQAVKALRRLPRRKPPSHETALGTDALRGAAGHALQAAAQLGVRLTGDWAGSWDQVRRVAIEAIYVLIAELDAAKA